MTDVDALIEQAERIGAVVDCPECPFTEPFDEYLQRDERVDEDAESIDFGCPSCESDTVELGREGSPRTIVVNGLDELEMLAGE